MRVVAATNLSLDEAILAGKFRRDLFHRLDAVSSPLAAAAGARGGHRASGAVVSARIAVDVERRGAGGARKLLVARQYPGTAELSEQSLLFAPGGQVEPRDLPLEILLGRGPMPSEDEYSLDGLEQQTIYRVLAQTGGHQQKAADLLGISRRTLIRKLKLYRSPEHFVKQAAKLPAGKRGVA